MAFPNQPTPTPYGMGLSPYEILLIQLAQQQAKQQAPTPPVQAPGGELGRGIAGLLGAGKLGSSIGLGDIGASTAVDATLPGGVMTGANGAVYGAGGEFVGTAGSFPVATSANGGTMLANGATVGGTTPFSLAGIGSAGNAILPIAGAVGMGDLAMNHRRRGGGGGALQGATSGAAMGSYFGPVGAGIGGVLGGAFGLSKAGKQKDQYGRDEIRSKLQGSGFLDENYNVSLANGGKYNIGKDGGPRAEFGGRRPHEFDANRAGIGNTIGLVNPLAEILTGGDDNLRSNFAGYFTNAASSSGDDRSNALSMYQKAGINSRSDAQRMLRSLKDQGRITPFELAVYDQGLVDVFENPQNSAQGTLRLGAQGAKPVTPMSQTQSSPVPPKTPMTKPYYSGKR